MRKTILMLINGFGVERKGSAEVYSEKLMPNFDYMIKNYLFGNLVTTAGDYNTAYKNFSIPEVGKGVEDEIDSLIFDKKLDTNEILIQTRDSVTPENNLHIFYSVEGPGKFSQFRELLKTMNPNKDKKVFVHLIMTATSTSAYEGIKKIISKVAFELADYCKVGMVVGREKINTDDVQRAFYRELGEHWNESEKKFAILEKEVVSPEMANVFIIGTGFSLKEGDSVVFMNYEEVDMEKFYGEFTKVPLKQFSLYPFKNNVPFMFKKDEENSSNFSAIASKHGIKILALTSEARINDMNFYLNGMVKKKSPNITYAVNDMGLFASKEAVIDLISNQPYDGFIIDYTIAEYNKMDAIKTDLKSIDEVVKNISEASREKDFTFIISSLYGIHKPIMDGVVQKVVDFSGKVPIVFQSNAFTKGGYALNSGSTYALAQTFLTNISDEVKANKLVHKLSSIEKMLTKGK